MEQADILAITHQIKNFLGTVQENNLPQMNLAIMRSPLGSILAGASENGICFLSFIDPDTLIDELDQIKRTFKHSFVFESDEQLVALETQLELYFKGELTQFDLSYNMIGTDFQKQVWSELLLIPYGKTISYKEQSIRINNEKAIRAVGTANGANPMPIIVPCHRVIGENGKLVGYSGGLWRKEFLLKLENNFDPKLF